MYTREASALDLFTDSVRLMGDATICGVLEFDTRLDPDVLGVAAHACMLAHPILHSRLVRGDGPAFWEMAEPDDVAPVRPEECGGDYHPLVIGPVDPYGPVQFRVRLLRRSFGDVIVINLAHAAADAYGLHTLMSQLLEEYITPGSISPADGGIPERDTLWTRELYQEEMPAPSAMQAINPLWPDPFGRSSGPITYHRESVTGRELTELRGRAGTLGGSVNDAVMAAYFLAMSDLTGYSGPIDIFFPVNLRRYLRDGSRVMSNQATNVAITLERFAGEGMEEVLPRVIEATNHLKNGRIGIAEQVAMDAACDMAGKSIHAMAEQMAALQEKGYADIFISNPGSFTLPSFEGLADAYVCYPGGFMPTTCFVTSTFRGHMTITMGYQKGGRTTAGTKKAMDLFRHYLLSVVD